MIPVPSNWGKAIIAHFTFLIAAQRGKRRSRVGESRRYRERMKQDPQRYLLFKLKDRERHRRGKAKRPQSASAGWGDHSVGRREPELPH
ncbi:hypothetical protein BaRGS_00027519 [Batillaria attramentaria]|uniref:Uncharacterized protein n=1 Tax=Batillaria attramentaria TaxID=370345 RepID=A0ABD0K2I3_9CAEN